MTRWTRGEYPVEYLVKRLDVEDDLDAIIAREGRVYTNDPDDPGGPTKFGITLKTLRAWRNNQRLEARDVELLTEAEARDIYFALYIVDPDFLILDDAPLRSQLIDFGVHSGPSTATRELQIIIGAKPDGRLGPATLRILQDYEARTVGNKLAVARTLFLCRQVVQNPRKLRYLFGWVKRALAFIR
jgi:lysozyme family protein